MTITRSVPRMTPYMDRSFMWPGIQSLSLPRQPQVAVVVAVVVFISVVVDLVVLVFLAKTFLAKRPFRACG